jgi:hypothetical protein
MKHTLPGLLLFTVLAFASCKSNNDDQNPLPTNLLSGYLTVSRQLDLDSPATKYTEGAWAAFFMHPYAQPSDSMHLTVDSVKLNGISFGLDNATKTYLRSTAFSANTSCKWQVWSSTNVASISYNFSTPYPTYISPMPDTIDRAAVLNIALPTGSDSATVSLSANKLLMNSFKGLNGSISATDLSTLSAGNAVLEVAGYKMSMQAFGGKNFLFTKRTVKTKAVWLK